MSDVGQGPGWWQATDGKWYAPETHPDYRPPQPQIPPPPPMVPPEAPASTKDRLVARWRRHPVWWTILAVFIVLFVIGGIANAVNPPKTVKAAPPATTTTQAPTTTTRPRTTTTTSPPTTTTTTAPAPPPTTTTAPPPTTTAAPAPATLFTQSGSGIGDTAQFTVTRSSWQLQWSYDCSSFGSSGNFIVTVNGYGGASGTSDAGVNELGTGSSGDEHYYDSGTFNLSVNSECNWTVTVVQP